MALSPWLDACRSHGLDLSSRVPSWWIWDPVSLRGGRQRENISDSFSSYSVASRNTEPTDPEERRLAEAPSILYSEQGQSCDA